MIILHCASMNAEKSPPAYFVRDGDRLIAQPLALGPWAPNTLAGGPVSGLVAALFEDSIDRTGFHVARYTLDFLGRVPSSPLRFRVSETRPGKRFRSFELMLHDGERDVVRATFLLVRDADTPAFATAMPYPLPSGTQPAAALGFAREGSSMRGSVVQGGLTVPGHGIVWLRLDGEIIAGQPASLFAKLAQFADYGGAIGREVEFGTWGFPNIDISLQLFRMPATEWILLDSHWESAGNGYATAINVFADEQGIVGRGSNTLFISKMG